VFARVTLSRLQRLSPSCSLFSRKQILSKNYVLDEDKLDCTIPPAEGSKDHSVPMDEIGTVDRINELVATIDPRLAHVVAIPEDELARILAPERKQSGEGAPSAFEDDALKQQDELKAANEAKASVVLPQMGVSEVEASKELRAQIVEAASFLVNTTKTKTYSVDEPEDAMLFLTGGGSLPPESTTDELKP